MTAYIFTATNTVTKRCYIGKRYSVKFDKTYIGDNPGVLEDARKYGTDKFIVRMIRVCETVKECDAVHESLLKQFNAKQDEHYYNYEPESTEMPAKKTRKKKVVEE